MAITKAEILEELHEISTKGKDPEPLFVKVLEHVQSRPKCLPDECRKYPCTYVERAPHVTKVMGYCARPTLRMA